MKIRNKELLNKYVAKHANVRNSLQHWIDFVEEAEYNKIDCKTI